MAGHDQTDSGNEKPANGKTPSKGGCGGGQSGEASASAHAAVSSESTEQQPFESNPVEFDQVAESYEGDGTGGEIENQEGFDPSRALKEGMPVEVLTDDLRELGDCGPEGAPPESICGSDDRVRVTNTTSVPWRWLCKLIISFPNGASGGCTGWFIGPKAVMTAGHCVYSQSNGGWARRIEVIPGMNGSARPYGSMVGTSFRSVAGWTTNGDQNYDYGCIILPSPSLGNQIGYFGFAALTDSSLNQLLVNNSGYPGDKPFGTQWFNAGRIASVTSRKFYYMLDTYGGQSGSPTWRFVNNQRHAVGIHAYGGCPNSSTRITSAVFNNMQSWRSQ